MDWAEELKMSIRKTTARKGRRSKSRDLLKESTNTTASSSSLGQLGGSNSTDLSIDITLDMQSPKQSQQSTSTSNNISTSQAGSAINTSSTFNSSSEFNRPPALRRISGGWADSSVGNKHKSKKGSFEDERFDIKSSAKNPPSDEIPVIPDLDDIKDDNLMNEINKPPSVYVNRVVTLKELNTDLLSQNAFSAIEDVDLSILTKCLQPQETLDEADEVWEWEKLFTDVIAEINTDKPLENKMKNLELRPDELPLQNDD